LNVKGKAFAFLVLRGDAGVEDRTPRPLLWLCFRGHRMLFRAKLPLRRIDPDGFIRQFWAVFQFSGSPIRIATVSGLCSATT
jgi:hypothetical protein